MFAKVKSSIFIDELQFQVDAPKGNCLSGVLRYDQGWNCGPIETDMYTDR